MPNEKVAQFAAQFRDPKDLKRQSNPNLKEMTAALDGLRAMGAEGVTGLAELITIGEEVAYDGFCMNSVAGGGWTFVAQGSPSSGSTDQPKGGVVQVGQVPGVIGVLIGQHGGALAGRARRRQPVRRHRRSS